MPTLLQINTSANRGSTGHIAEEIAEKAMAKGWKCYTAYSRSVNPSQTQTFRIGNARTVKWHGVLTRLFDMAGLGAQRATHGLIEYMEEIKPDVVHLHNIHGYVLNYKVLFEYLNEHQIPVVWTFHDFWAITGHCSHFVGANCERWKFECNKCPLIDNYPKSYLDFSKRNFNLKKRLFSTSNLHIVAVSKWVEELTKQSFLKGKDIRCIENGVDLNVFKHSEYYGNQIPLDKYVIMGVASQWSAGKGFDDYLKLSKLLADDEVIVLVGLQDPQLRLLPDNVVGIKRTESVEELAQLYTRADVVTSLSYAETFGLTIVEGYACGTPAIVYDNTAPPSLIKPGTGRVVPTGDVDTLYKAIQDMKTYHFKSLHSCECVNYARESFDKDKLFETYVDLYEDLLKRSL